MAKSIREQINIAASMKIIDKEFRNKAVVSVGNDNFMYINTESVLDKYREILMKYVEKYEITGPEAVKYDYKPTLLAYDVYGSVEMTPFILYINNMVSASQFTNLNKGIYLFNSQISNILNEIMNKEEGNLERNVDEVDAEISALY